MKNQEHNLGAAKSCEAEDLLRGWKGVLLWCVPIAGVIVGMSWPRGRAWLWIPAFFVMGMACMANAARCRRLHCYLSGPLFLLAAAYVVSAELHVVSMRPGIFLDTVLVLSVIACLAEIPFGRYRKKA